MCIVVYVSAAMQHSRLAESWENNLISKLHLFYDSFLMFFFGGGAGGDLLVLLSVLFFANEFQ